MIQTESLAVRELILAATRERIRVALQRGREQDPRLLRTAEPPNVATALWLAPGSL